MKKIVSFIFLSIFALALVRDYLGPNRDSSKFRDIENLWTAIPPYGRSIEKSSDSYSGGSKANISKYYKSDADFDDIRSFYHEVLISNGWTFSKEEHFKDWWIDKGGLHIYYRRGDYTFSIVYPGKKADYGWDYAVGIYWRR
jgi:hypothetical protein